MSVRTGPRPGESQSEWWARIQAEQAKILVSYLPSIDLDDISTRPLPKDPVVHGNLGIRRS